MKLEGFKEFYFNGRIEQVFELIELHKLNGCNPYNEETKMFTTVFFDSNRSTGCACISKSTVYKSYTEAKEYLLSFAKSVMPVEVSKPKRKKLEISSVHTIEGTKYSNGFIDNKSIESYESHLAEVRQNVKDLTKYLRHYRIAKKRGF